MILPKECFSALKLPYMGHICDKEKTKAWLMVDKGCYTRQKDRHKFLFRFLWLFLLVGHCIFIAIYRPSYRMNFNIGQIVRAFIWPCSWLIGVVNLCGIFLALNINLFDRKLDSQTASASNYDVFCIILIIT